MSPELILLGVCLLALLVWGGLALWRFLKRLSNQPPSLLDERVHEFERRTAMETKMRERQLRSFMEDEGHYICTCTNCGKSFLGYKGRVTCKVCQIGGNNHEHKS